MSLIRSWWVKDPLMFVLLLGLLLRLIAAVFAQGYLMHDDHFLIVEAAGSWAHGADYNHWLPWTPGNVGPEGHSFFYVGLHYLMFKGLMGIGLEDPKIQMLIIRILHAFYSLLTILLGYRIAMQYGNREQARLTGLLLAVLFFLPNFSVRNLVEVACIPPLLASVYFLTVKRETGFARAFVMAGIFAGLAVGVRYQSGLVPLGMGLVLLWEKQWRGFLIFGIASGITFFLTQLSDLFIWGRPFAELTEYIRYNFLHGSDYFQSPPYMYILTIAGALIPPVSIFLFIGFAREFRRMRMITLPALLFFVVHSLISNKQERFIVPILPLIMIAGIIGWFNWKQNAKFWSKREWLHTFSWGFFWVINGILLTVACFSYGKKARVEAMYYVYKSGSPNFVVEYSFRDEARIQPQFYSGYWGKYVRVDSRTDLPALVEKWKSDAAGRPELVLFYEEDLRDVRIKRFHELLPIEFEALIEPSFLDQTLHDLNPKNRIERVDVYKIRWDQVDAGS